MSLLGPCAMWLVMVILVLALYTVQAQALAQTHEHGEECDRVIHLKLGDSFSVFEFPPYPQNTLHSVYGQRNLYRGSRECTWVFKARDCQLEFRQRLSAFKRGDVDCEENYLLMGDENREQRFCGFKKPPRRLNSTGTRLFMTHFARNGRHRHGYGYKQETLVSRMSGVVRCVSLTARPRVCAPKPLTCSRVDPKPCRIPGRCQISLNLGDDPNIGAPTQTITCNPPSGSTCQNPGQMCFETVAVNSTVPLLPPVPPLPGVTQCSDSIQIICSKPGTCTGFFNWVLAQTPSGQLHTANLTCVAEPECTCVFQGNACYTTE